MNLEHGYFLESDKYSVNLCKTLISEKTNKPYDIVIAYCNNTKRALERYAEELVKMNLESSYDLTQFINKIDRYIDTVIERNIENE